MPRQTPGLTALILLAAVTGALPALADKGDVTCHAGANHLGSVLIKGCQC